MAGGSGTRMGTEIPKQFLAVAGKPVLMHTVAKFFSADPAMSLIVVLPENQIEVWKKLCEAHKFEISHEVIHGGDTRFQSVKNGLTMVKGKGIVAVHDGVRPLVSSSLILKLIAVAAEKGNAVPCIPVSESVREISGSSNKPSDRNSLVLIQTPQCFDSHILKKAYLEPYRESFTDDASVAELMGEKINLVEGERDNIKITFPSDLDFAGRILRAQS